MIRQRFLGTPDRVRFAILSSMARGTVLTASLIGLAPLAAASLSSEQRSYYAAQLGLVQGATTVTTPGRRDATADAVIEWRRLRESSTASFDELASFLIANPGWPDETKMRRDAERALDPANYDPRRVVAFFARFEPLTPTGRARHAIALAALGQSAEASAAARAAWAAGVLTPDDESRLLAMFSSALTVADHDARVERLLWDNAASSAVRVVGFTSPQMRPFFEARLAMQQKAPDLDAKLATLDPRWRNDPGYIVDRAGYLRTSGRWGEARSLLAAPRTLSRPPLDAEEWFETLLTNARGAATDGNWQLAYDIARQIDDAYLPGIAVRDRPLGERDDYTSLAWLAGTTALNKLRRPADAVGMFERYANAARSPQTQAKGQYWAGRAALAAGRSADAQRLFAAAATHFDQFYGQLAAERLGTPLVPPPSGAPTITASQRQAYDNATVVRAAQILGELGAWRDQTQFLRQISMAATSDVDHALAFDLAERLKRPDLAVMIGRSARLNGHNDYTRPAYPVLQLGPGRSDEWTIIHAITRQESQFDREAVSRAGARGLMQLMPGTAREQAGKLGLSYDSGALTGDMGYNIMLGSAYFQRMLSTFNGSYPLAIAAYNAGPGNVSKWLKANGDPRTGAIDWLEWIEAIPLSETRGYVQHVLENAVVYDLLNPDRARVRAKAPLTAWIGKAQPG